MSDRLSDVIVALDELEAMGFAGDPRMKLPHDKSSVAEIVLFFRPFRLPGKYHDALIERRIFQFYGIRH